LFTITSVFSAVATQTPLTNSDASIGGTGAAPA
jgi:hypothetical protein